ncbi:MAG: hypothetical protein DRJ05_03170 [Bacteroidetes bacterium]|nr:MAG: hypothetical protein DRJ05_03170 [Bacteroidota bacterium]
MLFGFVKTNSYRFLLTILSASTYVNDISPIKICKSDFRQYIRIKHGTFNYLCAQNKTIIYSIISYKKQ